MNGLVPLSALAAEWRMQLDYQRNMLSGTNFGARYREQLRLYGRNSDKIKWWL